jgi:hypothetical protein
MNQTRTNKSGSGPSGQRVGGAFVPEREDSHELVLKACAWLALMLASVALGLLMHS